MQFKTDGTNAGAPVSLSGGTASCTTSNLDHGWHWVEADYAGDGNFSASAGFVSDGQLVNTSPVAVPDILERAPTNGVTVSIATLLTNDWDADGDFISFVEASASSANGGTVVSDSDWVTYTPAPGFTNTDTFTYLITDSWGALATGVVIVYNRADNGPPPNLTVSNLGIGSYAISGSSGPGRTNRILFVEDLSVTNWQTLGTATASPSGLFQFIDTNMSVQRFYRSVYP